MTRALGVGLAALVAAGCSTRLSSELAGKKCDAAGKCADGWVCRVEDKVCVALGTPFNRPPVVVITSPAAGSHVPATGATTEVALDGAKTTDPDGDALTFAWSEGDKPLSAKAKDTVRLAKGPHELTLTASNAFGASASKKAKVTVDNAPPVAVAPPDQTVSGDPLASVTLDLSKCADADGLADVTYAVTEPPSTAPLATGRAADGKTAAFPLDHGVHALALTLQDAEGATSTAMTTVTVQAPPSLTAKLDASPTKASTGGTIAVTATITNSGEAIATGVSPSAPLAAQDSTLASVGAAPPPVDVAPGETAKLTWTATADASGAVKFSLPGLTSGDANAPGAPPLSFDGPWTSPSVTIVRAASLSAEVLDPPSPQQTGATFTVVFRISNNGGTTASAVGASVVTSGTAQVKPLGAPPPQVDIAPGASADFSFAYTALAAGEVAFNAGVSGHDALSGAPLSLMAVSEKLVIVAPPNVETALAASASTVDVGQPFTVRMTVTNHRAATITNVAAGPLTQQGAGSATLVASPAPKSIAPGQSAAFVFSYTGAAHGAVSFGGAATFQDGGATLTANASSTASPVVVQEPAAFAILAIHAPANVSQGQTFAVTVDLQNTGGARAEVRTAALAFGASGLSATWSDAPPVEVAGGAVVTLTFAATASGSAAPGPTSIDGTASGVDENSQAALAAAGAAQTATSQVQRPPALTLLSASSPSTQVSRGQAVAVTVQLTNGGQATALLGATTVRFSHLGLDVHADYTVTPQAQNPASLGAGATATLRFSVDVHADATLGAILLDAAQAATDANSGADASASGAQSSGGWTVQTPAAPSVGQLSAPPAVAQGQPHALVSVPVTNNGAHAANFGLRTSNLRFTAGGADVSAQFTCAESSDDPGVIAAQVTATLHFDCAISPVATVGVVALAAHVVGVDGNSGAAISADSAPGAQWTVQSPAALSIKSVVAPTTVKRGDTPSVQLLVSNGGGAGVAVTSAQLRFTQGGVDVGADYDQTVVSVSPADLPGGASGSVTFNVVVRTTAHAGTVSIDGAVQGVDDDSGLPATASGALQKAGWTVQQTAGAQVTIVSVASPRAKVSQGQSGVPVTVTVRNDFTSSATIDSAALTFATSAGNAASDYTVATSGTPPSSIPAGATATFSYVVGVSATAVTDVTVTIGAAVAAHATSGSGTLTVSGPDTPLHWIAQSPAKLVVLSAGSSATQVSQREAAAPLAVVVKNGGGATLDLGAVTPLFTKSGVGVSGFTATPVTGNPTQLAGGQSATLRYTVAVSSSAPTGTVTLDAQAAATDDNTGTPALGSPAAGALATASWTVVTPAALAVTGLGFSFADGSPTTTATQGQSITANVLVKNAGGAAAVVGAASLAFTLGGQSEAAFVMATRTDGVAVVGGGASAALTFTVALATNTPTGALAVQATVSSADANGGASSTSTGPIPAATLTAQSPPALAAVLTLSTQNVQADDPTNSTVQVSMAVQNSGGATAQSVAPSTLSVAGDGAVTLLTSAPAPQDIPGGMAATFRWSYSGVRPCRVAFSGGAAGLDANTGAAVSAALATSPQLGIKLRPHADAGRAITLLRDDYANLDGTASASRDCDAITYKWTQSASDSYAVALSDSSVSTPLFEAQGGAVLHFTLTVSATSPTRYDTASVAATVNDFTALPTTNLTTAALSQHGIAADAQGRVAVGTDGGAWLWNLGSWREVSTSLADSSVDGVAMDALGRAWFTFPRQPKVDCVTIDWQGGADVGVEYTLNNARLTPAGAAAVAIAPATSSGAGDAWVAAERDLWRIPSGSPDGTNATRYAVAPARTLCAGGTFYPYYPCSDTFYAVAFGADGRLYAGTDLALYSTANLAWTDTQTSHVWNSAALGAPNDQLRALSGATSGAMTASPELWVGSGLSLSALGTSVAANGAAWTTTAPPWTSTSAWTKYGTTSDPALPSADVRAIATDASGDVWLAVGGALARYKRVPAGQPGAPGRLLVYKAGGALPSGFDPTGVAAVSIGGARYVYFATHKGAYVLHQ